MEPQMFQQEKNEKNIRKKNYKIINFELLPLRKKIKTLNEK